MEDTNQKRKRTNEYRAAEGAPATVQNYSNCTMTIVNGDYYDYGGEKMKVSKQAPVKLIIP